MKTDITILLDRSGSMQQIKADTIGGFNAFLAEQKALPGEATLAVVQFDSVSYDLQSSRPIALVEPLTDASFQPRGNTPLIDALYRVIDETGTRLRNLPVEQRPERVVMVIITDGQENASKLHTRTDVLKQIEHQQTAYNWTFVYLGANQDAIQEAKSYGIPAFMAATYTNHNTTSAYAAASNTLRKARSGVTGQSLGFEPDEIAAMVNDEKS